MMRFALIVSAVLICAAVAVPVNAQEAVAAAAGLKIGIVDLNDISEKYEKHNDEVEKLKVKRDKIQAELERMQETLKGLETRLQLFDADSEEYENINLEMEEIKLKLLVKKNTEEKKIERRQIELVRSLYNDIQSSVKAFARENGYDLILVKMGEELMSKKIQEIFIEIRMKPVIYANDDLFVTDKLIDFMNARYRRDLEKVDGMQDQIQ